MLYLRHCHGMLQQCSSSRLCCGRTARFGPIQTPQTYCSHICWSAHLPFVWPCARNGLVSMQLVPAAWCHLRWQDCWGCYCSNATSLLQPQMLVQHICLRLWPHLEHCNHCCNSANGHMHAQCEHACMCACFHARCEYA